MSLEMNAMQEEEREIAIDAHEVPEAILWLLGAFRLVDLHDSSRTPGSTTQNIPLARPGNEQKGLWLDIGLQLLNYLVEKDLEQPGNYASIRPFIEDLTQRHSALCEEDILFVVRQLSRPTEVWMRPGERDEDGSNAFSTKQTTLIDRTRTGELVRLTPRGQQAMQIAQAAREWIYTGNISESILKAIKWGDCDKMIA